MFMLKSTHDRLMQSAKTKAGQRIENLEDRLSGAIGRNLAAQNTISGMGPDYELGKRRRASLERDNAKRKASRAAAKVAK
jgi:hypothetical protein